MTILVRNALLHPLRHRFDWSMIVCYAVFMALVYTAVKSLGKTFR